MKKEGKPSILFATERGRGEGEGHRRIPLFNRLFFVLFLGRVGSTSGTHHLARGLFCTSLFFHQTSSEVEHGNLGIVEALLGAKADVNL